MSSKIEFFYDYVSVYSYLADTQVALLSDVEVIYRPMFLGAVMQATGNSSPAAVEAKRKYLDMDCDRWAARYGVPLSWNPIFPQKTLGALRLATAALEDEKFAELHRRLFAAAWVEKADLGDPAVLRDIVEAAGLSAEHYLKRATSDEIKGALKATSEEAVERGVFGGPTMFVGDEMFFGNDRLEMALEAARG